MLSKPTTPSKFPELPVEVQVALIDAAASLATAEIAGLFEKSRGINDKHHFFEKHFRLICDALYEENRR